MRSVLGVATLTAVLVATSSNALAGQAGALKIVVLAGEDAVNVIQQKTAVAPLVEVRDRNDQPVAGALVTFTIGGGKSASFGGGLQTLSVTTNAAGRAVAAGLNPLAGGSLQINVQAAFQGQIAAATIAQTNVMTAAEAAAMGASSTSSTTAGGAASSGGTGGAAGGAAGGGGGLSGGAIAGIAGAAAAGAVVAVAARDSSGSGSSNSGPNITNYVGPITFQYVFTQVTTSPLQATTCQSTRSVTSTMTVKLEPASNGSVSGTFLTDGTRSEISVTASQLCSPLPTPTVPFNHAGPVAGTPGNLAGTMQTSSTGISVTATNTFTFSGALNGNVLSGTVTFAEVTSGLGNNANPISGNGSATTSVTLNRQ